MISSEFSTLTQQPFQKTQEIISQRQKRQASLKTSAMICRNPLSSAAIKRARIRYILHRFRQQPSRKERATLTASAIFNNSIIGIKKRVERIHPLIFLIIRSNRRSRNRSHIQIREARRNWGIQCFLLQVCRYRCR